jgi:hypothetical protein
MNLLHLYRDYLLQIDGKIASATVTLLQVTWHLDTTHIPMIYYSRKYEVSEFLHNSHRRDATGYLSRRVRKCRQLDRVSTEPTNLDQPQILTRQVTPDGPL